MSEMPKIKTEDGEFKDDDQARDFFKRIGVSMSRTTLFNIRKDGDLPYYRFKGKVRYLQADLDAYVQSTRVGAGVTV